MFIDTKTSLLLNSSDNFRDFAPSGFRISINAAAVFSHVSAVVLLFDSPGKTLEGTRVSSSVNVVTPAFLSFMCVMFLKTDAVPSCWTWKRSENAL